MMFPKQRRLLWCIIALCFRSQGSSFAPQPLVSNNSRQLNHIATRWSDVGTAGVNTSFLKAAFMAEEPATVNPRVAVSAALRRGRSAGNVKAFQIFKDGQPQQQRSNSSKAENRAQSDNSLDRFLVETPYSNMFARMEEARARRRAHAFDSSLFFPSNNDRPIQKFIQSTLTVSRAAILAHCTLNAVWYTLGLSFTWRRLVPLSSPNTVINAYTRLETLSNALFTLHVGSEVMRVVKFIGVIALSPLAHSFVRALHKKFRISHSKAFGASVVTLAAAVLATWTTMLAFFA